MILTQTGLPDPLEQVLATSRSSTAGSSVREIQRGWELKAELVTLSACETALGPVCRRRGVRGVHPGAVDVGARSVCLSLWKVDDTATALVDAAVLRQPAGRRPGLAGPLPKAEALAEAKAWLRGLGRAEAEALAAALSAGDVRGKGAALRRPVVPAGTVEDRPFSHPYYWAAFVLIGDPD